MILLLLAVARLALAGDEPADGRYTLPDSGFTLTAPDWHMSRWSDYDFKGHNVDNTVFASAWSTSFQLGLDEETGKALAAGWKLRLEEEEHATDVVVESVRVEDVAGQKRVRATLTFATGGGVRGVYSAAGFATEGLTAQVATLATVQNKKRGVDALDALLAKLEITKPPAALGAVESLVTAEGSVSLPTGWRNPLAVEGAYVAPLFGKTGAKDAAACKPAIRPRVGAEADVMLACTELGSGGILDTNSFDDEATLLGQRLFGKGADKLQSPERVARGEEDVAILFHANDGLWVGGLPTSKGVEVVWVSGASADDRALGDAARAALGGFQLAPEFAPNPSFGALMFHRLTYDRMHPTVLIPGVLLLALLGFLVRMIFKSTPQQDPGAGGDHYT